MSHLGQFPARSAQAHSPELPLPEDEVVFLFKCEWDSVCSFWDFDGGANRVLSVPRSALGDTPTLPPVHAQEGSPLVLPEFEVASWSVKDDGAPAALEHAFYDYGSHNDLPDEIAYPHDGASAWRTKFGGVPYWTGNGAQGIPPGRLLLQIDNWITLEDGSVHSDFANFCSDGTAFVFIDQSQSPPAYWMTINR